MGDSDDSSKAAQRALGSGKLNGHGPRPGFWWRLFGATRAQPPDMGAMVPGPSSSLDRPLHGMMNLRRMRVEDVAIPKAEIIAVPDTITKDDLVTVFRDSGLTRLPVYDGTLDTPVGMAHLKDLALQHGFNGSGEELDFKRMLRPLLFVPPSMPIGVLLPPSQADSASTAAAARKNAGFISGVPYHLPPYLP